MTSYHRHQRRRAAVAGCYPLCLAHPFYLRQVLLARFQLVQPCYVVSRQDQQTELWVDRSLWCAFHSSSIAMMSSDHCQRFNMAGQCLAVLYCLVRQCQQHHTGKYHSWLTPPSHHVIHALGHSAVISVSSSTWLASVLQCHTAWYISVSNIIPASITAD